MSHPAAIRRALTRAAKRGPAGLYDKRYALGRALAAARDEYAAAIGGDPSPQQAALIGLVVRTQLLVDSLDTWLAEQNLSDPAVLPALTQRRGLADSLARYLSLLGLERRDVEGQHALKALVAEFGPLDPPGSGQAPPGQEGE